MEPESKYVKVRDVRLHYVDWGGDGPPALLVHGDQRTSRSWDGVAGGLRSRFHVLSLDQRGHGKSDWTPRGYRVPNRVADVVAFIEALDLRDIYGIGHSTGAALLTFAAIQLPQRFSRLALVEALLVCDKAFQDMVTPRGQKARRTWASREELYQFLLGHPATKTWDPQVIRIVADREAREHPDGSVEMMWSPETFNDEEREGDFFNLLQEIPKLTIPVLVLVGGSRRPTLGPTQESIARTPKGCLVVMDGAGHNNYMEKPGLTAEVLLDFAAGRPLPEAVQAEGWRPRASERI